VLGIGGALVVLATIFLTYDVARRKISPCDGIFEEASLGLSTKIKFLSAQGELKLGRESIAELSDRAQMTALDLKTCCTVLDAGRIDPEQFLECKAKARNYDARLETIATLLGPTPQNAASTQPTSSSAPAVEPALTQAVDDARKTSEELNRHVVEVVKAQALQNLQFAEVKQLAIDGAEREPNDDLFHANLIGLDKTVTAAIRSSSDVDFYTFTTPPTYRDWIRIEFKNQSTTLEPKLELFDAMKTSLGEAHNTTPGADLVYSFVSPPSTTFSVKVSSYYGQAAGAYALRIAPAKAYDAFEPNDDILSAKAIAEGKTIEAGIMDKDDVDFFSVSGLKNVDAELTVVIVNKSTTLHPNVVAYDASKTEIGSAHNSTAGGDLTFSFKASGGKAYVKVSDYYVQAGGDYTLAITSH
jgi:hypothetical protein